MIREIIALIVVVILIVVLKGYIFQHRENCIKSGGIWYEEICLNAETKDKDLKNLGLIVEEKTDKTNVYVTYPYNVVEYPEIFKNLQNKVEAVKKDNGFDGPDIELGLSGAPWTLNIDMNNFSSGGGMASVLGYVFSFTGGAHPNHTFFVINFEKDNQNIIKLDDLFTDYSKALKLISEYAVENIIKQKTERLNEEITEDEWVQEGAGPSEKNYSIFVFFPSSGEKLGGIKFIFPPYQVGPYYQGTYEVDVPSEIFYDLLDEKYKSSFKAGNSE